METNTSAYDRQLQDIARRSSEMKKLLVENFRKDDGTFLDGSVRSERDKRNHILESAVSGSVYSLAGDSGNQIAAVNARVLQNYETIHGHMPADDLLASAHRAIENGLAVATGSVTGPGIFEGVEMSTTDGIIMRDRLVSLVLPVYLTMITSSMVTYMPGDFNQSEFFRIKRQAGSTFGDLTKGDIIDYNYRGIYTAMDQRVNLATGDGSTVDFTFSTSEKYGVTYPLKAKRTRIYINKVLVAIDNGAGQMLGMETVDGVAYTATGTIDYATGELSITFNTAPGEDVAIDIAFDVDIEKDPHLIPRLDHFMQSKVLFPHEAAVNGGHTIQALWGLRRELGQDLDSMLMQTLRNVLAADKDKKHLYDMYYFCNKSVDWVRTRQEALTLQEQYETLNAALLDMDSILIKANGVAGLTGLVGGQDAVNVCCYLPEPYFRPTPGYRKLAQPHFVGTLFGRFDLYCDPFAPDSWSMLGYARGADHGQTAYVAGDAVPALTFRHPVLGDLTNRATMWELAYRDLQPFDGAEYLCKLNMVEDGDSTSSDGGDDGDGTTSENP